MSKSALHELLTPIELQEYGAERFQHLWEKISSQRYAFDDFTREDPTLFFAQFGVPNNIFWEVGDLDGLVMVQGLRPRMDCILHFSYWGKAMLTSLVKAGKSLEEHLFSTYQLNRITAFIPSENKQILRLAVLLGFTYEGNLRKSILYNGNYQDVFVHGILRSEWERFRRL